MKPWSGRFQKGTAEAVERFTASVPFDKRLYRHDILGSIAHAHMLAKQGIIAAEEAEAIVKGLEEIAEEIATGSFPWRIELEDVHMNIEARLKEKIGEVAGKLHTARSRNDQVALDMRLFTKEATVETIDRIVCLQETLARLATSHLDVVMPGYTHLQRAQPVLLSHHLMAYFEMFQRDMQRFAAAYERCDTSPLGAGALAGTTFSIDREFVASALGFSRTSRNSIDAVSDRDFVIDYIAAASVTVMHLSRLAEEIVLWSSSEFDFVELDDAYATGSSMMPQKKNPDVAELIRGKTGRIYGHLQAILTTLKGLPLAYNRDLQEDKEALFDTVDTLISCLEISEGLLASMKFKKARMREAAEQGFLLATDVADYLTARGVPFRMAHEIVGKLVAYCLATGKEFPELTIDEYRSFSPVFDKDVLAVTVDAAIAARNSSGGTSPQQVQENITIAKQVISQNRAWLQEKQRQQDSSTPQE